MPYLSFVAICLLFGSNFMLMARASLALGPMVIGAGRVLGAAALLAFLWRVLTPSAGVPRDKWLPCLAVGLVANGYPYVAQPYLIRTAIAQNEAAQNGGVGHSFFGMMVAFTPLLTILVSVPMLGVWPTWRQVVGVLGGLGFMGLLMFDGSERGVTLAMLAMAFSIPLSYATANTYLRRSLNDVPALALSTAMLLSPAVVLTPLAALDLSGTGALEPVRLEGPAEPQQWATAIGAVGVLGVLGTGATMWLFVRLVQTQGPLFAGMVTYVVPLIALLWGLADGERISSRQMIGIAGVLTMVALVQFGGAKPPVLTDRCEDDSANDPCEV